MGPRKEKPARATAAPRRAGVLTQIAFVLAVGLGIARATMMEILRESLVVAGGASGGGPATTIAIDLLLCVPAILILARRCLDSQFALRPSWGVAVAAGFALWTAASVIWASDKFAAAVGAANIIAAVALLWAMSQLVRSWLRLRLVAACAFGLMLLYVAAAAEKRFIDQPAQIAAWKDPANPASREAIMKQQGWTENDFAFRQFELKLLRGDVMPFTSSPNSYAAIIVLLGVVATGLAIQRRVDGDSVVWTIGILAAMAPAALMLVYAGSRTAAGVVLLAMGSLAFLGVPRLRACLAARARFAYWSVVVLVTLGAAAVVGHGLYHGRMPEKSLTFRWYYWTGAARMVQQHPALGVGWENFGQNYTAVRPPQAPEEVKDPHNFIVRAFAELGIIGGLLMLAWMARMWWEMGLPPRQAQSGPVRQAHDGPPPLLASAAAPRPYRISVLITIAATAAGLGLVLAAPWAEVFGGEAGGAVLMLEGFRRVVGMILLVVGLCTAIRSARSDELDDRPAPWVLYAVLIGLGGFLLHNLLEFSLFEPAGLVIFAMLAGSALGMRQGAAGEVLRSRRAAVAVLVSAMVAWIAAASGFWVPTLWAENGSAAGDRLFQAGASKGDARLLSEAAAEYLRAAREQPLNADYLYRAARAMWGTGGADRVRAVLKDAIAANPTSGRGWAMLARFEATRPAPDRRAVDEAFQAYLRLDPADVPMRLENAAALEQKFGDLAAAREQYRVALEYDDKLPADEPKRLPPEKRREAERKAVQ